MSYEANERKEYNDRMLEKEMKRKEEIASYLDQKLEAEMRRKEAYAALDRERQDREFTKDAVTKQYLLEQEEKKRRIEETTSQYFLDRELEREESESKTSQYLLEQELKILEQHLPKKYESLESFVQEILGQYPSINLKDFYQILSEKQSSREYLRNLSKEELEELIDKYFKYKNNQGRRR